MVRYVIIGVVSGLLFGIMDGLIQGNPVAQRLFETGFGEMTTLGILYGLTLRPAT